MNTSSRAVEKSWLHHKTSLKCAVNANPPANFTWFKDDRPILDGFNSSQDISTLTLTPKTAGDFGLYSCKATNNKGSAWHNITLEQLCKFDSLWRKASAQIVNSQVICIPGNSRILGFGIQNSAQGIRNLGETKLFLRYTAKVQKPLCNAEIREFWNFSFCDWMSWLWARLNGIWSREKFQS